jgi:hypothetical protein
MQPNNEQGNGQHYGFLFFILLVSTVLFFNSCSEKKLPVKYKHPEFYSEKKVIVQNTDKFYINDIPKGEVKK